MIRHTNRGPLIGATQNFLPARAGLRGRAGAPPGLPWGAGFRGLVPGCGRPRQGRPSSPFLACGVLRAMVRVRRSGLCCVDGTALARIRLL